jgi:hypothetical protein
VKKLGAAVDHLSGKGIPKNLIWEQGLITPSCGTGSLSVASAERVFRTLAEVSRILRHGDRPSA